MIYAIRERGDSAMLVEVKSQKALDQLNATVGTDRTRWRPVTREYAHKWVKADNPHETGLYLEEGRIKYAREGN